MRSAPKRGEDQTTGKEKAPQRQPGGPNKSHFQKPVRNASAPKNQEPERAHVEIYKGEKRIVSRGAIYSTTENDDPKARERRRRSGARAGLTLRQVRDWIRYQGLHHPVAEDQETYLEVVIAQYLAIQASRPRWTLGLATWIKRYRPELYKTRSGAWIDSRIEDQRREGTYFSPAEIGRLLGVTRDAYLDLKLTDIWPAGMTPEERKADQRAAKAAWQRASDLARGRVTRPHAQSLARTRPWDALGISESTWKRRRRLGRI
jgi:hypothetical protein